MAAALQLAGVALADPAVEAWADRLLQSLAQTLDAYPQRIERCAAVRLNGADFALLLPAPGLARADWAIACDFGRRLEQRLRPGRPSLP